MKLQVNHVGKQNGNKMHITVLSLNITMEKGNSSWKQHYKIKTQINFLVYGWETDKWTSGGEITVYVNFRVLIYIQNIFQNVIMG